MAEHGGADGGIETRSRRLPFPSRERSCVAVSLRGGATTMRPELRLRIKIASWISLVARSRPRSDSFPLKGSTK